jgi:predicted alpha/beta-hydrolase family hydrolase
MRSQPRQLAVDQFHPVVREAALGLPQYTVYRPADLDVFQPASLPVIVAANGACRNSNQPAIAMLTLVAARGFVVVAIGAFDAPAVAERNTAMPERLPTAMDWAVADPRAADEQFRGRLDPSRLAVMGISCGGIEALVAAADPRVRSALSLNSGFFSALAEETPHLGFGREHLRNLHTPTLFVSGGPSDVAFDNTRANYELVSVPTVWADNPHAGHSGLWYGYRDNAPDATLTHEAVTAVVQWLDFTLNDQTAAGAYFLSSSGGLGTVPGWSVSYRNFSQDTY